MVAAGAFPLSFGASTDGVITGRIAAEGGTFNGGDLELFLAHPPFAQKELISCNTSSFVFSSHGMLAVQHFSFLVESLVVEEMVLQLFFGLLFQ